jgi:hypothetical protein
MLLNGSGDEFCGPLPALFQAAAHHLCVVGPSAFPALFSEISQGDQLHGLPYFSGVLSATLSFCCVLVFGSCLFLFFYFLFFLLGQGDQSAQWTMMVYHRGGWGNTI